MRRLNKCEMCGDEFLGPQCPRCEGKPMSRAEQALDDEYEDPERDRTPPDNQLPG